MEALEAVNNITKETGEGFIQYANGFQQVWGKTTLTGSGSNLTKEITYPMEFVGKPILTASVDFTDKVFTPASSEVGALMIAEVNEKTAKIFLYRIPEAPDFKTGDELDVTYHIMGWWKH